MASKTQKKGSATAQRPVNTPTPDPEAPIEEQTSAPPSQTPEADRRLDEQPETVDPLRADGSAPRGPDAPEEGRVGDADGDDDRAPQADAAAPKSEAVELPKLGGVQPPKRYPVAEHYAAQFGQSVQQGYDKHALPALEPVAEELAREVGLRSTADILRPLVSGERMITTDEVAQLIKSDENRAIFAKALGRYKGQRVGRALCFMVAKAQVDAEALEVGHEHPELALLRRIEEGG